MFKKGISIITPYLVVLATVVLPLQTHFLFSSETLHAVAWPWTEIKIYVIDVVILFAALCTLGWKREIPTSAKRILQIFLLVWIMIFFANSINQVPFHSWFSWMRFGEGIIFAWMIVVTRVSLSHILRGFIAGMFISAFFGVWQFGAQFVPESSWFGVAKQEPWIAGVSILASSASRFLRSYGSFSHPNIFAGYLSVAIISVLYLALRRSDHMKIRRLTSVTDFFKRNGWTVLFLVLSVALIFSFSRNGWLATGVGAFLFLLVSLQQHKKTYYRIWTQAMVVGFIIVIIFGQLFLPLAFGRVTLEDPHEQVSLEDRKRATNDFEIIMKDNWMHGVGLNRFTSVIQERIDEHRDWWETQPVHNIYLLLSAEASIFTGLVFVIALMSIIALCVKSLHRHDKGFPSSALGLTLVVMVFLMGMFDHYLISLAPGIFLFFFVIGAAIRTTSKGLDTSLQD